MEKQLKLYNVQLKMGPYPFKVSNKQDNPQGPALNYLGWACILKAPLPVLIPPF